jgi:hypothetical protein
MGGRRIEIGCGDLITTNENNMLRGTGIYNMLPPETVKSWFPVNKFVALMQHIAVAITATETHAKGGFEQAAFARLVDIATSSDRMIRRGQGGDHERRQQSSGRQPAQATRIIPTAGLAVARESNP